MPGQTIQANEVLAAGLRNEFWDTYAQAAPSAIERVGRIMDLGIQGRSRTETFAYFESAPYPVRQPRGETVSSSPFRSVSFSVEHHNYSRKIEWHEDDEMDDMTDSLMTMARMVGQHFVTLPERIAFQLLSSSTDSDLLPAIPLAPDGAALFSTTDGSGGARFGATDGNSLTGGGVASGAAIRSDLQTGLSQFRLFQDTEGQPLLDDSVLESELTLIYPASLEEVFREAFIQSTVQGTAAGVSNVVLDAGLRLQLWSTPRLTGDDWYIALSGAPKKPLFQVVLQALEERTQTIANSDVARDTGVNGLSWKERGAYGIGLPYGIIRIDN